jgi:hypothetical protein
MPADEIINRRAGSSHLATVNYAGRMVSDNAGRMQIGYTQTGSTHQYNAKYINRASPPLRPPPILTSHKELLRWMGDAFVDCGSGDTQFPERFIYE